MALTIKDRVKEATTVTGTGAIPLGGSPVGFQAFSTLGNGNSTYYSIYSSSLNEWEVGVGTYAATTNSISRDTVLSSSNSGALVSFSAGLKEVICTLPASVFASTQTSFSAEVQTATAGQTVFVLTSLVYNPGANSLAVYVNGLCMVGGVDYIETAFNTVTFTSGLALADQVLFIGGRTVNDAIGAEAVSYIPAGTGAVATSVRNKLREAVSVKDFGAVGNGVTDDTAAIQAAATQSPYYAPPGTYVSSTANATLLSGKQYGVGQIKTADANKSAPYFSVVSTAPSSFGNESSILTAFNGDLSRCQFPVGHSITGTATLGQPTTGYLYRPEAVPHYTFLYNSSGWNQSTSGNDGRTGAAAYRTKVFQAGQGDSVCYNGSVFVTGTKAGSTDFLANPAGSLFNGDMAAGAAGVYLNPYETFCSDQGYDVACVGVVNNFERTVSTGAKSAVWLGYRAQSVGAASCDAIVSATGKWVTGVDLAIGTLDFGTNKAAISLKADDRIYFNNTAVASGNLVADWRTTVFNKDYLEYNTAGGFIQFVRNNSSKLQIGTTNILVSNAVLGVNNGTGGSTAWIRDRQAGFALPTGTTNTATFDTATVTTARLAEYVKGMVERLHASTSGAHWLFGT